jgi:hypothetical protein
VRHAAPGAASAPYLRKSSVTGSPACAPVPRSGAPPGLGLIGVHRIGLVVAAARMGDVVDAAAEGPLAPAVDDVERQRHADRDRRVQGGGQRPRRQRTSRSAPWRSAARGGRCRSPRDARRFGVEAFELGLQAFHRGVRGADSGGAGAALVSDFFLSLGSIGRACAQACRSRLPTQSWSGLFRRLPPSRTNQCRSRRGEDGFATTQRDPFAFLLTAPCEDERTPAHASLPLCLNAEAPLTSAAGLRISRSGYDFRTCTPPGTSRRPARPGRCHCAAKGCQRSQGR